MIGVDTNVLVRFLVQDDREQSDRASRLMASLSEESQGFVGIIALTETVWVLQRAYRVDRADVAKILRGLLDSKELQLEHAERVRKAIPMWLASAAGFSDALILQSGLDAGCDRTVTFDQKAALLPGMNLL